MPRVHPQPRERRQSTGVPLEFPLWVVPLETCLALTSVEPHYELRAKGVSETCPLCRACLPPGREKLFELGYRVRAKLGRVARRPDCSWRALSASQQGEMDGAIVMMQAAMDQVSVRGR